MTTEKEKKLRLLEHYVSVQGEGPRVGIVTQFIRFAGCNLKCPLWPCDTPEAIDPKLYRQEQVLRTAEEVYECALYYQRQENANNICITGGEPMLQPTQELSELIGLLVSHGFTVEMFSNGTLPYTWDILSRTKLVLDWKLPGSGESSSVKQRVENLALIHATGSTGHTIKFTVADYTDLLIAEIIYNTYLNVKWKGDVYVGPVYGKYDPKVIVRFITGHQLPWKLNLQVHKYIYGDVRSV